MRLAKGTFSNAVSRICFFVIVLIIHGALAVAQQSQWDDLMAKATSLLQHNDFENAEHIATDAVSVAEQIFGPNDIHVARSLQRLGEASAGRGREHYNDA